MRRTFLTWLLALICTAFAFTVVLTYSRLSQQMHDRAEMVMSTRLDDLMNAIRHNLQSMQHVEEINNESTLEKTRALAEIIKLNPAVLQSQEELQRLSNLLGADEISVSDKDGIVIAAVPGEHKDYDLNSRDQSREFMACINNPGHEICQRAGANGYAQEIVQYSGVSRLDEPGVVQLGFKPQHERVLRTKATFAQLAANYKLGQQGQIVAFRNGALLNSEGKLFPTTELLSLPIKKSSEIVLGGEHYLTYVIESDGYRLVGLLPEKELMAMIYNSLRSMLLSNLLLFVVIFVLVGYLLQRLVVRGIKRINDSLRRITNGELQVRVEVTDSPELARLSTGINTMVDTLQAYGEKNRESLSRELQLASEIQRTALPCNFPAFPEHPEFDLYATCTQANVIGGDFYDFFTVGDDTLCFLLADCSDNGIPAALFMMRTMTTIRGLASAGNDPVRLVTAANHALCEGNPTGISMSLFFASLNFRTGKMRYVNAGPPQALLRHEDGEFEMLSMQSGPRLGVIEEARYRVCKTTLRTGDHLFLYTGGVVAAQNVDNTPFGTARLQQALQQAAHTSFDLVRTVHSSLRHFTDGADISRDMSVLALLYNGEKRNKARLTVHAGAPEGVQEMIAEQMEEMFAAPQAIAELQSSASTVLSALPSDCQTKITLTCTETLAELRFSYPLPGLNPLKNLPQLLIDKSEYRTDETTTSTLTLLKNLE